MSLKILMVEDDTSVAEMMEMFFKKESWSQDVAVDGVEAVEMFKEHASDYDLITLDLNLPKKDGIEVAKEVRQISPTVPIIMLTARGSEADQVLGLGIGADDGSDDGSGAASLNATKDGTVKVVNLSAGAWSNDIGFDISATEIDAGE